MSKRLMKDRYPSVTILGANSAVPTKNRFSSAQLLEFEKGSYLIDCGEGAQIQLSKFSKKVSRLKAIFISHLHGDHILGLPGLLNSMALSGRDKSITIFSPVGLRKYVECYLEMSHSHVSFPIEYVEFDQIIEDVIYADENVKVTRFPLKHRIPTTGYRFDQNQSSYTIDSEKIKDLNKDYDLIKGLKQGMNLMREGSLISFVDFTSPKCKPVSYAYCSDTIYLESVVKNIEEVDLLYHEATYLEDMAHLAAERGHSTAKEAAQIAKQAKVGKLILGHYSSRYLSLEKFVDEASEIFKNVDIAVDGKNFELKSENN